ncbi:MAG: CotH kinase family protein [Lachnospiraceae bacterium]|nr:CotH kinase family protein [Lachnospiraceae bacterium]
MGKKGRWLTGVIGCLVLTVLTGCSDFAPGSLVDPDETYEKEALTSENYTVRDKDSVYEGEEEPPVVTMYLTVGRGNEKDGTDHTWKEVNAYPLSYYEEKKIEPYRCEAVLQVGDELGPLEGEFGYGVTAANSTVQLRGAGASVQPQKSYKITIKEGKGKLYNARTVALNKHSGDATRFANRLCYSLMQEIPQMFSARTRFVHLYVKDKTEGENGLFKDYGLYTQVEQINKTYLKNRGLDHTGNLYKAKNFDWRRHEDSILTAGNQAFDQTSFEQYLEIKGDQDHTKLIRLLEAVNDESLPVRELIDQYFDRDNLYYWMAFHILMGNKDVEAGNYYLYSPQGIDKWYILSWDNDGSFEDAFRKIQDETCSSSWRKGIFPYISAVLYEKLLKDSTCRQELDAAVEDLRKNALSDEKLEEKIREYQAIVRPYVYSLPDRMYARLTEKDYDRLVAGLTDEVETNYQTYRDSLQEPWPFHIHEPQRKDKKLVLGWDASYLFGEGEVSYRVELARDYSFEECLVSEDGIRDTQLAIKKLPEGQYFLRVRAESDSGALQDTYEYYHTEAGNDIYSTMCFYVQTDGSIVVSTYDEEE